MPRDYPLLESIRFNNFKGIEQLELQMPVVQSAQAPSAKSDRPALLILGENAAGKSSILEAAALVLCSEEACAQLPVDFAAMPLDPVLLGAGRCLNAARRQ
ncbi:hypothetical protein QNM99_25520 [Pseudomonas sp. PCH446]